MAEAAAIKRKQIFGHPMGLFILFLTEMWERFSYYGMRAILVLFLVAKTRDANPGFGWDNGKAIMLYGWYTMFVYLACVPGGILADKFIGQKKAVGLGGLLLVAGHSVLAIQMEWAFYLGLVLIVLGVGALKPNISTMVGGLYPKNEQNKRDMGFYIFYMGINLGAAAAALLVGYVGEKIGWHYGFGLAGIGMAIGMLTFWLGQKHLKGVGDLVKRDDKVQGSAPNLIGDIFKHTNSIIGFVITLGLAVLMYFMAGWPYAALMVALAFAVGIGIVIYNDGNQFEKDRILVVYISFLIIIAFWGAFEQAGGLMNLYTKQKTDLHIGSFEVPASWFQSVNAIFILLFATIVGSFWIWWRKKGKESSALFKMAIGIIIMGVGFLFMSKAATEVKLDGAGKVIAKSSMIWLVLAYLFHTIGELCASPVALSFITKLAPARWMAFMMGAYFAATGLGNKLAGSIGESAEKFGDFNVFTGIFVFTAIIGLLVLLILKPLKRLIHGAEDDQDVDFEQTEGFELADAAD